LRLHKGWRVERATELRYSRLGFLAGVALLALAASACTSTPDVYGDRLFESPPWGETPERYSYRLSDRGWDSDAACEMRTEPGPTTTRLEERCSRETFGDETTIVVDSETLEPVSSERVLTDSEEGSRVTHTVLYEPPIARFATTDGDDRAETTRELPEPTDEHPDPGWYDDKSIFWLVRGLPLTEDYSGTYAHVINAGQPRVLPVDVEVEGRETVETEVGTFETWRVRLERDNTVYFLWVGIEEPRPVVKARIESATYELTEMESAASQ
jgi:hypothetical protein